MPRTREDVTSKQQAGANRRPVAMRMQRDILDAVTSIATEHGMSRTQYVEQVLAKEIRRHGGHTIRLKSLL